MQTTLFQDDGYPQPKEGTLSNYHTCGYPLIARYYSPRKRRLVFLGEVNMKMGQEIERCPGCGQYLRIADLTPPEDYTWKPEYWNSRYQGSFLDHKIK